MSLAIILLTPLITALIGWFTNWVAVQMLFHPRQPRTICGWRLQGLVPRRQKALAAEAAEIIERELLQQHLILQKIRSIDLDHHLAGTAHTLVWERIAPRLRAFPLVGSFISDKILLNLEQIAAEEIKREALPLLERIAIEFENGFHIREVIEQNIASFDLDQLETIVWQIAKKEFRTIEHMGAVLGALVGVFQIGLFYLANLI